MLPADPSMCDTPGRLAYPENEKGVLEMTVEVEGKIIPTSIAELIEPKSTALLVIDVQNTSVRGVG
jgi:hypothetical protein